MLRTPARRPLLAATLAAFAACKKSPPPVDFHSRATHADVPAADAPAAAPDAGPRFQVREGAAVTGDGRSVSLGGRTVTAPPGERFVESIAWDYDRDGRDESLFVARATDAGDAAGVSLVRPLPDRLELAAIIGPEPEDRSCGAPHFRQTSPRSLVLTWSCPARRPARADGGPRGMFAFESVLMGEIGAETGFRARAGILRDALPDTALRLAMEGADTDGDGRDELVIRVSAGRPGAEPGASARLVYFFREPVWVWETTEPASSIRALIDAQRRRAGSRRSAAAVPGVIDDLARLKRALCQEGSLQRFKLPGSTGVRCTPDPFEGAAEVALRALVTLGELPAAWAMTRAETAHALGVVPFDRVRSLLEGASTPERGATATVSAAMPVSIDPPPEFHHPVARWEDARNPSVVVLRGDRGSRVRRDEWAPWDAADVAAEGAAPLFVTDLPRARRLAGLAWSPQGLSIVLCPGGDAACVDAWTAHRGHLPPGAETRRIPMLPPGDVPDPDSGIAYATAYASPDARALGWGPEGLVIALRGRVWRVPPTGDGVALNAAERWGGTFPDGQSFTEDGRVAALPAPEGIWVHEGAAWHRLVPDALREQLALVREVSPSADGRTLLARLSDHRLAVIERQRPTRR